MGTEVFRTEVKSKFSLETYALEEALKGKKKQQTSVQFSK